MSTTIKPGESLLSTSSTSSTPSPTSNSQPNQSNKISSKKNPRDDRSDDEEDLVSEFLFLAKKHKIDVPTTTTTMGDNTQINSINPQLNSEEIENLENSSKPIRLAKRRFGIFR